MKTRKLLNQLRAAGILLLLLCNLTACGSRQEADFKGLYCIFYSDVDSICETDELCEAGEAFLSSQQDNLLLSHVVDRSIALEASELQDYAHLVVVNPQWIERYGDPAKLSAIELSNLSHEMREFLNAQMPLWTRDGSVLPEGVRLYEYRDAELLVFPPSVPFGIPAVYAKNPLLILVDHPVESLNASSYLLPLSSSGNVLFIDGERAQQALSQNLLRDYGKIHTIAEMSEQQKQ